MGPKGARRVAVVALTRGGAALAVRTGTLLAGTEVFLPGWLIREEVAPGSQGPALDPGGKARPFDGALGELVGSLFRDYEALVLIMATGIAVRTIAPHLRHKEIDPAVVVMDEQGRHAISLLSGHAGGANALARELAKLLGGGAVITTASDVTGRVALDVLAEEQGWRIEPPGALKGVMAALVNGETVRVYTNVPVPPTIAAALGIRPLSELDDSNLDPVVLITNRRIPVRSRRLHLYLRPRNLVAGIGCRKGASSRAICDALDGAFGKAGLSLASVRLLTSLDIKQGEAGLLYAAQSLGVPVAFISRDEVRQLAGRYVESEFVKQTVGVGGVCEPAALAASAGGVLILPKTAFRGVTVAIAEDASG